MDFGEAGISGHFSMSRKPELCEGAKPLKAVVDLAKISPMPGNSDHPVIVTKAIYDAFCAEHPRCLGVELAA